MSEEVSEAFRLSYGLLRADAALASIVGTHIYQDAAPQGVFDRTDVLLLGGFIDGEDRNGNGGVRLSSSAVILWRAVKRGQPDTRLKEADRLMDGVLANVRAVESGGYVFSIERERPYQRGPREKGRPQDAFSESGGFYSYFVAPRA